MALPVSETDMLTTAANIASIRTRKACENAVRCRRADRAELGDKTLVLLRKLAAWPTFAIVKSGDVANLRRSRRP